MILIPLGGQKWVRSFFWGGFVGAPDGQNSSVFVVSGANSSMVIGPILAVAAVKLTFIISQHPKNR